ncbi:7681_t:CDS:2 [Paraglomus occultum]|uniref:7681_t:CDS:1 n=1 Tax=Paraglomus occultum TaxID=144539 RepID=A0A9N8ZSM4_9GLOM|nr:7681_t:CDS:2 [Paraglomus occultum]
MASTTRSRTRPNLRQEADFLRSFSERIAPVIGAIQRVRPDGPAGYVRSFMQLTHDGSEFWGAYDEWGSYLAEPVVPVPHTDRESILITSPAASELQAATAAGSTTVTETAAVTKTSKTTTDTTQPPQPQPQQSQTQQPQHQLQQSSPPQSLRQQQNLSLKRQPQQIHQQSHQQRQASVTRPVPSKTTGRYQPYLITSPKIKAETEDSLMKDKQDVSSSKEAVKVVQEARVTAAKNASKRVTRRSSIDFRQELLWKFGQLCKLLKSPKRKQQEIEKIVKTVVSNAKPITSSDKTSLSNKTTFIFPDDQKSFIIKLTVPLKRTRDTSDLREGNRESKRVKAVSAVSKANKGKADIISVEPNKSSNSNKNNPNKDKNIDDEDKNVNIKDNVSDDAGGKVHGNTNGTASSSYNANAKAIKNDSSNVSVTGSASNANNATKSKLSLEEYKKRNAVNPQTPQAPQTQSTPNARAATSNGLIGESQPPSVNNSNRTPNSNTRTLDNKTQRVDSKERMKSLEGTAANHVREAKAAPNKLKGLWHWIHAMITYLETLSLVEKHLDLMLSAAELDKCEKVIKYSISMCSKLKQEKLKGICLQIHALFVFQKSKLEYCHLTLRDGPNLLGNTLEEVKEQTSKRMKEWGENTARARQLLEEGKKVISDASNSSGRNEEGVPDLASHVSLDGSIHVVKSYMLKWKKSQNVSERTSNA